MTANHIKNCTVYPMAKMYKIQLFYKNTGPSHTRLFAKCPELLLKALWIPKRGFLICFDP